MYKSPTQLILTAYFTSKSDIQRRKNPVKPDNPLYLANFYASVIENKLHAVVLHDYLSEDFVNSLSNEYFTFNKGSLTTQYSSSDERFLKFLEYLENNPVDEVFLVDISDIWFKGNPFNLLSSGHKIYFGDEDCLVGDNDWLLRHYKEIYGQTFDYLSDKQVLNCGIIGGKYENVLELLREFRQELFTLNKPNILNDMAVFNHLLHKNYKTTEIYHGGQLNSPYKSYLSEGNYYIFHK